MIVEYTISPNTLTSLQYFNNYCVEQYNFV
mgnify:CR=1 FL=1|jgi:hypothetical protein